MRSRHATIEITTGSKHEILDVTEQVVDEIARSGIIEGWCIVQSLHTTAGVLVNVTEDLDGDIVRMFERLCPSDASYDHNRFDPNAEAHLKKLLVGRDVALVVRSGRPVLGTWEKVQFAEFDGPRARSLSVSVFGE